MDRRTYLATVGALATAGCTGIIDGTTVEGEVVVDIATASTQQFTFDAESGDDLNIYVKNTDGGRSVLLLLGPEEELETEAIEAREREMSVEARNTGTHGGEILPAGENEVELEIGIKS